jgi:hypothetical protein
MQQPDDDALSEHVRTRVPDRDADQGAYAVKSAMPLTAALKRT